ncbi:hypothetical protein CEP53_000299 [Fusarium sp. AF-6]|nr:hypothetical protein CEP53_000299 [Fusarium sp. AF-6]
MNVVLLIVLLELSHLWRQRRNDNWRHRGPLILTNTDAQTAAKSSRDRILSDAIGRRSIIERWRSISVLTNHASDQDQDLDSLDMMDSDDT